MLYPEVLGPPSAQLCLRFSSIGMTCTSLMLMIGDVLWTLMRCWMMVWFRRKLYTFVNLYKVRHAFRQKADGSLTSEAFSTGMMCDESMKKWERYSFLSVQKLRTLQCNARHFYNQMSQVIFFLLHTFLHITLVKNGFVISIIYKQYICMRH